MVYKKRKKNLLPSYIASSEESKWYRYCITNNIRICTIPVEDETGKWKIGVNIGPYKKGEIPYMSPHVYDKNTLYYTYYQMCKYYYDKRKK